MNIDKFELFKTYLETAEKTTDRRGAANTWLLSVNAAITGFYGFLAKDGGFEQQKAIWLWAIPTAGILISFAWWTLLGNYRKLNSAKFRILNEMEDELGINVFKKEYQLYKPDMKYGFSDVEQVIPLGFIAFYLILGIAAYLPDRPHS